MDEAAGEGEQPDDGEQDSKSSDDFGVDEAALRPSAGVADRVEIGAVESGDDGGKDQLRNAKDHANEVCQDHIGDCKSG